jgi:probable rRNA maturation factor
MKWLRSKRWKLGRALCMLELRLSIACARSGIPSKSSFNAWAQAAFDAAAVLGFARTIGLSLRLVGLDEAKLLNAQYRGRDYATNVLSFPADVPPGVGKNFKRDWLGDLVICAPVIAREAAEQGKAPRNHFAHMCVHGVLHLLGFDHLKAREAKAMEALEVQILAQLGFANPYLLR